MQTQYVCNCYNNYNDITYGIECDTLDEAMKYVSHYRKLINDNGEEDQHSHIEVAKETVDEEGNILSHKSIKSFSI